MSLDQKINERIKTFNPHWSKNRSFCRRWLKLPKRQVFGAFTDLIQSSTPHRAVVLMGPRRVGKTTLLHQAMAHLIEKNKGPNYMLYVSLDEPLFHALSLRDLIQRYMKIHKFSSLKGKILLFDEIQYFKNWHQHLKVLVDEYDGTKFIVSGSAAGALRRQSIESGAGRFTDFMLMPMNFLEYLQWKKLVSRLLIINKNKNSQNSTLQRTGPIIQTKNINLLNKEFIKYIHYGGFPESTYTAQAQKNIKRFVTSDIIEKVLLRDIPSIYGIADVQELNRFFYYLAYHTGAELNLEKISTESSVSKSTINKYIEYLEAAFLIRKLRRIDDTGKSFRRQNVFKIYLTSPSFFSAIYNSENLQKALTPSHESLDQLGSLIETAVLSQYLHHAHTLPQLYYVRLPNNRGEVDFAKLDHRLKMTFLQEIKWTDRYFHNPVKLKSLLSVIKKNPRATVQVSTKTQQGRIEKDYGVFDFQPTALMCCQIAADAYTDM